MFNQFDKDQIARSFNRAAKSYERVDFLQREVGDRLLEKLKFQGDDFDRVVDIGCGTGRLTAKLGNIFSKGEVLGVDLADEMVIHASRHFGFEKNVSFLSADADELPLPGCSFDLVFSNLMLQWSSSLEVTFGELARIIRPGGRIFCSTFGFGSLKELRNVWSEVDGHKHASDFISKEQLLLAMEKVGFKDANLESYSYCRWFNNIQELMGELKLLGAHNLNVGRQRGLSGKNSFKQFELFYDEYRNGDNKLPLTFEVYYVSAKK